jgi:chitin disaccharide deacetylase
VKFVIFNADDFGYGKQVTRGIVDAHRNGVVTATTMVVNGEAAHEAAELAMGLPGLSVGLHANFTNEATSWFDIENEALVRDELQRQFDRFVELMGRKPAHLDSHQHVHRARGRRPIFRALARAHGLPLRDEPPVVFRGGFYGQWEYRVFDPSKVSAEALGRMLREEVHHGMIYEISCHPGYFDPEREYVYHLERESELRTLCDPRVRDVLREQRIEVINYDLLPAVIARLERTATA